MVPVDDVAVKDPVALALNIWTLIQQGEIIILWVLGRIRFELKAPGLKLNLHS
jgi:hypothetical protein